MGSEGRMFDDKELERDENTEYVFSDICADPVYDPSSAEDMIEGINQAIELESQPLFLEGLSKRLTELGVPCTESDTELMLGEVKRRYKDLLGKPCPKAVENWVKGTTPGITNRCNNFDLCYALELNYEQVYVFFQKFFLTIPFNVKSREDAVYLYCFYHHKSYETVVKMLADSDTFVPQENAHTATSQIAAMIQSTDDDDKFMKYLSKHCYGNKQQFQLARQSINQEIEIIKETISKDPTKNVQKDRANSSVIAELLGYKYQREDRKKLGKKLPKRFRESLINDETLGKIIRGEEATYETLRKALMLLKFYSFYSEANNTDEYTINGNLLDFHAELNNLLCACGFARLYERHPFDCLLLYCANTSDPIVALHCVNEYGTN